MKIQIGTPSAREELSLFLFIPLLRYTLGKEF
jgi:hypothetical protein